MNKRAYRNFYGGGYFVDRIDDDLRTQMELQEITRLKKYIPKKGNVLDVGCGLGEFLSLFDHGWDKYGIEISQYAIRKAKKRGVKFTIPNKADNFDLVIFRGTIQHLDKPFSEIQKRIKQLKPGGFMVFLATPNTGGLYYRIFQDLPFLDPKRNFLIPSDKMFIHILENLGLKVKKIHYPYKETPYAHPLKDFFFFALRLFGIANKKHAFPKNMMEVYAQKP